MSNAAGIRCQTDESGACVEAILCGGDPEDDCLAADEPRAWSSPIFVNIPHAAR